MFLHVSVILSTGGLSIMSLPVWLSGPMDLLGGSLFMGVFVQGDLHTPKSEKRMVRILLECFLVFLISCSFLEKI